MRVVKPWVAALHIDEAAFAGWTSKIPRHESVTFWCLDKGHVRLNDYFNWAMDHYGLAMLTSEYFNTPANRELWNKIQSVATWGPEMLPVDEWDGTVFIACVEPPSDVAWSFPVRYVLATPRDLKAHWERLQNEPTRVSSSIHQAKTSPAAPAADAPEGLSLNLPPVDGPEGLSLNLNLPPVEKPAESSPPGVPDLAADSPDGLDLSFVGKNVLRMEALPPEGMPEPPKDEFLPDEVVTGVGPNPLLDEEKTNPTIPLMKVPEPDKPEPMEATSGSFVLVDAPKTVAASEEGAIDSDRLAPASLEVARNEAQAIAWVFQQLKQHFRNSWLLTSQNGTLRVWKWESSAKPVDAKALEPIDLSQPSLFRIVSRTGMPYHGHVVESPTNTGFFRLWGLRKTPAHVTAVPLTVDGHVVAILLCSGEKPAQPDAVLRFTEKMSLAIVTNLGRKAAA